MVSLLTLPYYSFAHEQFIKKRAMTLFYLFIMGNLFSGSLLGDSKVFKLPWIGWVGVFGE